MAPALNLGEFEQLVLLAILRLGDEAYGVTIRAELAERGGRNVAPGALYTALERLEAKRAITSRMGDPTPQRGGRRRKFYALRPAGVMALRQAYHAFTAMADGLERRLGIDTK